MAAAVDEAAGYGLDYTDVGPMFPAAALVDGKRAKTLRDKDAFFAAKHHDWKQFDWNGRVGRVNGIPGVQPLLSQAGVPTDFVALDQRRPSNPYRVARKIVSAFTAMVFGHGRFPQFRSDDPETADWAQALSDAVSLEVVMLRARNLGGRQGTVGLSWAYADGSPIVRVHKGCNIHVLEWADADQRIPAHVVELYRGPASTHGANVDAVFWHRRDWTPVADVVFHPAPVDAKKALEWQIDESQSFAHGDGFAHFVWIENLPDDDDENGTDGACDYEVTYESQIVLDMLNSVTSKGGILNLDPTLVLGMDREDVGFAVQKGSEHALTVGKGGSASYLELGGSSIASGLSLVAATRDQILETCECVVPESSEVAAAGTSAVALKLVYAPMLGKCDLIRYQYGRGISRLLDQMTTTARRLGGVEQVPVLDPETGEEIDTETIERVIALPPRVVVETVHDPVTGKTTTTSREETRTPGRGRIWLEWGPYFRPTADDDQKEAGALSQATGGKPIMSQRTAVEIHANAHDRDGQDEWARIEAEAEAATARAATANAGMFPSLDGGSFDAGATDDSEGGSDVG